MAATAASPRGILRKNATYTRVDRERIISPARSAYSDTYPPFGSSDEELHYGPGIVNRLRSRFLSKTVREPERHRPAILRRTASLEDWLEKDGNESVFLAPSPTATEPMIRNTITRTARPMSLESGLKKSDKPIVTPVRSALFANKRSVSTSDLRTGSQGSRLMPFKEVVIIEGKIPSPTTPLAPVILPPQFNALPNVPKNRRISTNTRYGVEDNQLPAPDTVRQVKRMFEEKSPPRDDSPGRGSREVSPAPVIQTSSVPQPPPPPPPKQPENRKVTPPPSILMRPRGFSKPAPAGPKPVISAPRFAPGARAFRQTVRSIPTPPRTKEIVIITQADLVDSSQNDAKKLPAKQNDKAVKSSVPSIAIHESKAKDLPGPMAVLSAKVSSKEIVQASRVRSAAPDQPRVQLSTDGEKKITSVPQPDVQAAVIKPVPQAPPREPAPSEMVKPATKSVNPGDSVNVPVTMLEKQKLDREEDESDFSQTKRIAAKALENIRKEGESFNFDFNKKSGAKSTDKKIGVIRPTIKEQEEKKVEIRPAEKMREKSPPFDRKPQGPRPTTNVTVEVKHKFVITNVVENADPPKKAVVKSGPRRQQEQQNSMLFNFVDRPKPSYVEDSKHTPSKQIYNKKDSGIAFITTSAESSDYVEQEDDQHSPPPQCNVIFENDNIIINGKSNIKRKPKPKKLNISFNDDATLLFEYPSEQSLVEEPKNEEIMTITETRSLSISPISDNSGGLASYTPSKVQFVETFELGVSRSTSLTPTPPPSALLEETDDFLRPLEDGTAFSNEATSDLLF